MFSLKSCTPRHSPLDQSGWLILRSRHMRAGLVWVPSGLRRLSTFWVRVLRVVSTSWSRSRCMLGSSARYPPRKGSGAFSWRGWLTKSNPPPGAPGGPAGPGGPGGPCLETPQFYQLQTQFTYLNQGLLLGHILLCGPEITSGGFCKVPKMSRFAQLFCFSH